MRFFVLSLYIYVRMCVCAWGGRVNYYPQICFYPFLNFGSVLLFSLCECCSASPNPTLTLDLM